MLAKIISLISGGRRGKRDDHWIGQPTEETKEGESVLEVLQRLEKAVEMLTEKVSAGTSHLQLQPNEEVKIASAQALEEVKISVARIGRAIDDMKAAITRRAKPPDSASRSGASGSATPVAPFQEMQIGSPNKALLAKRQAPEERRRTLFTFGVPSFTSMAFTSSQPAHALLPPAPDPRRDDSCPICLEQMVDIEQTTFLPCTHRLHVKCFRKYSEAGKNECPLCKAPINP